MQNESFTIPPSLTRHLPLHKGGIRLVEVCAVTLPNSSTRGWMMLYRCGDCLPSPLYIKHSLW